MTRRLSLAALLLLAAGIVRAGPEPTVPPDPLPKGATARLGTLAYRGPHAHGLTFTKDGKRLVGQDQVERFLAWDVETGKLLTHKSTRPAALDRFKTPVANIPMVAAPDRVVWLGKAPWMATFPSEVVVADHDGKVLGRTEIGDVAELPPATRPGRFGRLSVTPDGRHLATILDKDWVVAVFDLEKGERTAVVKLDAGDLATVALSGAGKTLFVARQGKSIRRYEVPGGKELPPLSESDGTSRLVQVSPNGKWVVTGQSRVTKVVDGKRREEDATFLEVWDATTGENVVRLEIGGAPHSCTFAGPEALLVGMLKARPPAPPVYSFSRWNLSKLTKEWEIPVEAGSFALSPDGKRVASPGGVFRLYDTAPPFGGFRLYDTATGKVLGEPLGHDGGVQWIGFSADGKTVTTVGGREVLLWTTDGEMRKRVAVPELTSVAFRPAGSTTNQLVWPGYTEATPAAPVLVGWDLAKGAVGWRMPASSWEKTWVASADGKRVLVARPSSHPLRDQVDVLDGPTGEKLAQWSHPRWPPSGIFMQPRALSGDGKQLVVLEGEAVVALNAETGEEKGRVKRELAKERGPMNVGPGLIASPDGSRVAVAERKVITIYDMKLGKTLANQTFANDFLRQMRFSPDRRYLAIWCGDYIEGQAGVEVWDIESAEKPRTFEAEPWTSASCTAFSPDGSKLAVGYSNGTALIWDLTAK